MKNNCVFSRPSEEKATVDGIIVKGKAHLEESFIKRESKPKLIEIDSIVIEGSIN